MSPGVNDGPRNTGTLPKSNRRNDRNRERSAANQCANHSAYHGHAHHSNNLQNSGEVLSKNTYPDTILPRGSRVTVFHPPFLENHCHFSLFLTELFRIKNSIQKYRLDWKPEREHLRITKNSNTRSVSSVPSTSYQDIPEFASYPCGRPYNYSAEEFIHWQRMVPPTDSQTQSPPQLQETKPSNVDKMPDRSQVESRLNQIKDYIRMTAKMMISLSESKDPSAQAQNEKLSSRLDDLLDSERKLTNLLEQYQDHGMFCESSENGREEAEENGDASREMQLRKKMEESQRKLEQLQEHQANLVGMQSHFRARLNEAREAQQVLLQQENQSTPSAGLPLPVKVEQLESETAALRGKLDQLQTKKKHMDHLVAELQFIEMSDMGSCSSDGSRNFGKDKAAELEAMKAQLVRLKSLMEEMTTFESEPEVDMNGEATADVDANEEEIATNTSFERQSDTDENQGKIRNTGERPTLEEIQAVTRELREQSALLQNTRAELQRLKQSALTAPNSNSATAFPTSTPPPSLTASTTSEKKQSNNSNSEVQPNQGKKQVEDRQRKESSQSSSINRDVGGPADINSHRSSNSQISHTSIPANVWPQPTAIGESNDQSVDGVSENMMDIGPQPAIENGFSGNWWASCPPPPVNQVQHGSAEYYRQLLLGSQAQQLQMMGTTLQQCCQLLWAQQRELQSMRTAITQLQMQLRQTQLQQRSNNNDNNDEYSNLSRNVHHLGETLDSTLPPSSSLPNLVSLPNSSPALSHNAAMTTANSQHQQQQLNNQVPPGNRANNYWDNFRSYSRQNLLSGNVKTTDTATGAIANATSSGNAISSVHTSLMKDKRNREQGTDHLPVPSLTGSETQFSLNWQLQSNLQQQERENAVLRSNFLTNEVSQQQDNLWEEAHSAFRLPSIVNDEHLLQNLSAEMKDVLSSLITVNKKRPDYLVIILREIKAISEDHRLRTRLLRSLRALQDTQFLSNPLNETTDQTASESCQSSDEDSEVDAVLRIGTENQSPLELIESSQPGTSSPSAHVPLIDHMDMPGSSSVDSASDLPSSTVKPGYNEDLAEADQSRPESSRNQQFADNEEENEQNQEGAVGHTMANRTTTNENFDLGSSAEAEDEINEENFGTEPCLY